MKFSARFLFEILLLMVHMHFFFSARLHELMRVRGVGGVCMWPLIILSSLDLL